jgi:hypothetical protein
MNARLKFGITVAAAAAYALIGIAGCRQEESPISVQPRNIPVMAGDCSLEQSVRVTEDEQVLVDSGGLRYDIEAEIARGYDNVFIVNGELVIVRNQHPTSDSLWQNYSPGPETNQRLADGSMIKFNRYLKSGGNEADVEFCIEPR